MMQQQQIGAFHYTITEEESGMWSFYAQDLRDRERHPEGLLIDSGLVSDLGDAVRSVELMVHQHMHAQLAEGLRALHEFTVKELEG